MVEYRFVDDARSPFVETVPGSGTLASEADALDLVGACGEHQVRRLLLNDENLPAEFTRLSSGLAGAALLKFSNYHLKVAALLPEERIQQGRFAEMALEANRRNSDFHVFSERAAAIEWLTAA